MLGLQRLLYGPLRPIEIEQLWDKAWYAITETALAMTTFRDEVGGWFLIMFVSLLAGKVWSWIAEGRVEILEQQPPANPRLFHTRLLISLLLSESFAVLMLRYCVRTLLEEARPGMMVMFAFEFAVLAITSSSTTARYALSLHEILVVRQQTKARLEERKQEIRAARAAAQQQDPATESDLPREEDVDESEIDVPGWQEKGRWVFYLDLITGEKLLTSI
jgi:E3 ubiquitin-protein ligase synoviolin